MTTNEAMERFGGSFVKALAECWLRADPRNRTRLKEAFPDYFDRYAEIARQRSEAEKHGGA